MGKFSHYNFMGHPISFLVQHYINYKTDQLLLVSINQFLQNNVTNENLYQQVEALI